MKKRLVRETLYLLEMKRKRALQPKFNTLGLSPGQPRILDCLLDRGEGLTQRELAEVCGLDATTLSRALDRLVEEGLVSREPHEASRRANLITLTRAGEEKAAAVARCFYEMDEMLCWDFTDEEMEGLLACLRKLRENMDGIGDLPGE